MMPQAARYLFDLDFSAPPEPEIEEEIEVIPPEPMITVAEHKRLLADAVAAARAEGEATALEQRELLASEESLHLQQTMFDEISMIYTEVGTLLQRLEKDASNLAFAFASRFAERLVAQEPKAEILALLHQILAPLRKTPHISIRLNDAVADEIKAMVEAQMSELGFTGKLTVIADSTIMAGDCEVEWADGGIGRNLRSAIRQVEQLLEDHFAHIPDVEDEEEEEEDAAEAADAQSDKASDAPIDASDEARSEASAQPDQDPALTGEATPQPMPVETETQQDEDQDPISTGQSSADAADPADPLATAPDLSDPSAPSAVAQSIQEPELPASTSPKQMETNNE